VIMRLLYSEVSSCSSSSSSGGSLIQAGE